MVVVFIAIMNIIILAPHTVDNKASIVQYNKLLYVLIHTPQ